MVVLTNDYLPARGRRPLRRCTRCKTVKWLGCYENPYSRRCIECNNSTRICPSCGDPAGINRKGRLREFCTKPECRQRCVEVTLERGLRTRRRRSAERRRRKTRKCVVCAEVMPATLKHFPVGEYGPDGEILKWDSYCRSCRAVDQRLRYQGDPERRARQIERVRVRREALKQRMLVDPVFAEQVRQSRREQGRRYREKRKERLAREAEPAVVHPSSGCGAPMPVGPLMVFIDGWMGMHGHTDETASVILGVSTKRFREWRRPTATTRLTVADQVLTRMGALWFDAWSPVEYPEVARIWEAS